MERQSGLDIIRCCAILFVIGSHYFLNTDFNCAVYEGADMFALSMWQTLTLINVPLFLILTGYLNINKKVSRKYYRGGLRVILTYLLISVITILFRNYVKGEHLSAIGWILKITDFSVIPYGWYVEMWLGLFLLTPFLNILWHHVDTLKHRQVLIVTLFMLTALPDFFNRYNMELVPGYWEMLYPVTFFYIGAYIRDYKPVISKLGGWILILGLCLINPILNLFLAKGHTMMHLGGDGNGIIGVPLAAVFFTLVYNVKVRNAGRRYLLKWVSILSLDMYLLSWMFDQVVYPESIRYFGIGGEWVYILLVCVPMVFVLSGLAAVVTWNIVRWMDRGIMPEKSNRMAANS